MRKDKRKSRRRPIRYTAWIVVAPGELRGGALSDISDTGARIDVDDAKQVPQRFLLWLSANGSARRLCQVVWRKPHQIGVKFEERVDEAESASLVPAPADAGKPARRAVPASDRTTDTD